MKVNFEATLKDINGEVIKNPEGVAANLRDTCINALLAMFEDEKNLMGEEKLRRWELALRIKRGNDPVEVSVEEITLIKKLTGKAYIPMVAGQTWQLLEGREV